MTTCLKANLILQGSLYHFIIKLKYLAQKLGQVKIINCQCCSCAWLHQALHLNDYVCIIIVLECIPRVLSDIAVLASTLNLCLQLFVKKQLPSRMDVQSIPQTILPHSMWAQGPHMYATQDSPSMETSFVCVRVIVYSMELHPPVIVS